ncbi:asparaginase [Kocuria rhizophila]|uniref:asparaginase n=1 Tax=Kocuria rhizophila TaxID=72000 RepID=UPI00031E44F1|nr:asparaginase [Kocuria rhizophila]MCT1957598.1 asparaginase [Kocuria rhizophila]MCT2073718.1 asparaginase [Kocuria rhizophila]PMR90848.1 asparaginase [Kocuria rhizophila]
MQTFSSDQAVELAVVQRSGYVESRHSGSAVVLAPDGSVAFSVGAPEETIFPRSTLKPFQAIASMKAGAALRGEQVAIAAASHTGTFDHLDAVSSILKAADLGPEALQCPPDWPEDEDTRAWLIRTERGKNRMCMNCSGKHAAFLLACVTNGWPTDSYLEPAHPLQQLVVETIEEFSGETVAHLGADGCGAPLTAISLTGLARMYSTLGRAARNIQADARAATVATSMLDYPEYVQGPGRSNTVVMEELDVITKLGAEGVLGLGTRSGWSVAIKMLDGSSRANSLVGLNLLVHAGAISRADADRVLARVTHPVTAAGQPVGAIELAQPLLDLMA